MCHPDAVTSWPEEIPMRTLLPAATRTVTRCLVCGFTEVRTDEVIDRGLVLLHECPRCEHRWTRPGGDPGGLVAPRPPVLRRAAGGRAREVAPAA
jgi:hypothetical protein